ncbi:Putative metal-dependent protease [Lunatimonas lonarensis]|uniref:Putative metal-dependent protease n=1 Tax=Lunatimonas lonarensis TaxID=1232681 RepID=R7ZWN1_9BACT|nr:tRNA (adenosine(37)-N6)-threonylcarbamoyltransferase complex dimerization subunit type 1 TsaB [Lunatimonas lonarensis]EON78487.1 Putative metal-dependent protease [Lunatimonas lonarensis]
MTKILSIETAATVCSVAVHEQGKLLGLSELCVENIHGEKLIPIINELLLGLGLRGGEMDAIAVSKGPGSYTGLRIGVSSAKGLAYAWDLPLIGVDTLDALARQCLTYTGSEDVVIAALDARRMEVYAKVVDSRGAVLQDTSPIVVDSDTFRAFLDEGRMVYLIGNATAKLKEVLVHPNLLFVQRDNSAKTVGEIAFDRYRLGRFENLAYFEPNYLKEFMVLQSRKQLLNS